MFLLFCAYDFVIRFVPSLVFHPHSQSLHLASRCCFLCGALVCWEFFTFCHCWITSDIRMKTHTHTNTMTKAAAHLLGHISNEQRVGCWLDRLEPCRQLCFKAIAKSEENNNKRIQFFISNGNVLRAKRVALKLFLLSKRHMLAGCWWAFRKEKKAKHIRFWNEISSSLLAFFCSTPSVVIVACFCCQPSSNSLQQLLAPKNKNGFLPSRHCDHYAPH